MENENEYGECKIKVVPLSELENDVLMDFGNYTHVDDKEQQCECKAKLKNVLDKLKTIAKEILELEV